MKINSSCTTDVRKVNCFGYSGSLLFGKSITKLFQRLFSRSQEKEYSHEQFSSEDRLANKCQNYRISLDLLKKEKMTNCFLNEHLLEKLEYFGHVKEIVKHSDVLKLPYTLIESLDDQCLDTSSDIKSYYLESKEKKRVLRIIDPRGDCLITEIPFESMSLKEFREILNKNIPENITFINPTEWLTIEELEDLGVLSMALNEEYTLSDSFLLTSSGFIEAEYTHISYLQKQQNSSNLERVDTSINFSQKVSTESENGLLEICVHKANQNQKSQKGHASLNLIDAKGYVYSVGFFPENSDLMFEKQTGEVVSPDPYIFFPKKVMQTRSMKFEFNSKNEFKRCFEYLIQQIQKKDQQQSYDSLHSNCAEFVNDIFMFAKKK